jgi:DNA-binding transcriptional MerR regulator
MVFKIGSLSMRTGLSVDAIRFYEKQRLLDPPSRTEGGFRLFNADDIERIQFIQRVQQLGFSLPEIRELLVLQRENPDACTHVRDLLRVKVTTVREKIRELRLLERQLVKSLRECERNLGAAKSCHENVCPVLKEAPHRGSNAN